MDVWLIKDGERSGPFLAYEIERRIRDGEIGPEVPAWIEGQSGWRPLGETPEFAGSFSREKELAAVAVPPDLPVQAVTSAQMIRRFWARWFDLHLFGLVWWGGMRLAGHDLVELVTDLWMLVWQMLPWFAIEALLIHLWGTTPGKALLGVRVRQANGRLLGIGPSVWRALRVWTLGVGMGMPLMVLLCQGLSFWVGRRVGRPLWDTAGDHRVSVAPIAMRRVLVFAGLFMLLVVLRTVVLMPAIEEIYGEQLEAIRRLDSSGS